MKDTFGKFGKFLFSADFRTRGITNYFFHDLIIPGFDRIIYDTS